MSVGFKIGFTKGAYVWKNSVVITEKTITQLSYGMAIFRNSLDVMNGFLTA